jgi:hypothetical protein
VPGKYEVTLDTSHQVLRLQIPEDRDYAWRGVRKPETLLYRSFAEAGDNASRFAPAAMLALKAKQFDDGLYACVEVAANAGLGQLPSKKDLILRLLHAVAGDSDHTVASILTAAARLGGHKIDVPAGASDKAEELQRDFLNDQLRSKVLGFYTWSEELSCIFRRDRMLQTRVDGPTAQALASAFSQIDGLFCAYTSHLRLAEQLTNPLTRADLRELAVALKEGQTPDFPQSLSLFPPSRAHETDLIKRLYGERPIPEGFDLADEMVKRLRDGTLDLTPTSGSGWYDHQTYALEALAVPERMPESDRLLLDESYRRELVGLFKALLALTRETHIKQLEIPMVGAALGERPNKLQLHIAPGLTLEPLATYYLRSALSYHFVYDVLERAFGSKGLDEMRRLTADGPVEMPLSEEIRLMQALFHGAYLQVCAEIGMAPRNDVGNPQDAQSNRLTLSAWLGSIQNDPDLGKDVRMMVPIFYDVNRHKIKVWAILGVATKPLVVSYATAPNIKEVKTFGGGVVKPGDVEVEFTSDYTQTAYFATAEVYVTRLLDRGEFRKHCDIHKTYQASVSGLK